ncbi:hypothetical protein WAH63_20610, partial [Acinetobacter baumannii]
MSMAVAFALFFVVGAGSAQVPYDRHVAFDNSVTDENYYYSQGSYVAPSELALIQEKVPVDAARYVSPPNSLRLEWRSRTGGD